jgi:hypothetical protein
VVLLQFKNQVTLRKKHHNPRLTIDWSLDLGHDWWRHGDDKEDLSWVAWAKENLNPLRTNLGFSSSGRSVNRNAPVVRLRWTDRDLVASAAD